MAGNNVQALRNLGLCLQNGIGTERDYSGALELFRKASAAGVTDAMCVRSSPSLHLTRFVPAESCLVVVLCRNDIGQAYEYGFGVQQNVKTAVEWYLRGAEVTALLPPSFTVRAFPH